MIRAWRQFTVAAVLVAPAAAAFGQSVVPAQMTGQPLQYMRDGSVAGCGLRIIAVTVNDDLTSEASEVSVNINENGSALFKAVAYANFAPGKSSPKPVKVASAWAKAPGAVATKALGATFVGDDKLSLLYQTEVAGAISLMKAQLNSAPVQIDVQRVAQKGYKILAGVVSLTKDEQIQLDGCVTELIAGMQRKVDARAASAPQ